jgi:hypothetical protein
MATKEKNWKALHDEVQRENSRVKSRNRDLEEKILGVEVTTRKQLESELKPELDQLKEELANLLQQKEWMWQELQQKINELELKNTELSKEAAITAAIRGFLQEPDASHRIYSELVVAVNTASQPIDSSANVPVETETEGDESQAADLDLVLDQETK